MVPGELTCVGEPLPVQAASSVLQAEHNPASRIAHLLPDQASSPVAASMVPNLATDIARPAPNLAPGTPRLSLDVAVAASPYPVAQPLPLVGRQLHPLGAAPNFGVIYAFLGSLFDPVSPHLSMSGPLLLCQMCLLIGESCCTTQHYLSVADCTIDISAALAEC